MTGALLTLFALALLALLASRFLGFGAQRPGDYAAMQPVIDVRLHLAGMEGRWEGSRGILDERFRYASGETQTRQWRLTLVNDRDIRAEADDLVRPGQGRQDGAGLHLSYRIRLPDHAGGWVLDVTDWMYLMENGTIINRSQFRKFGIKVAELVATMRRVDA